MSPRDAVRSAVTTALTEALPVTGAAIPVFDAPPVRASLPYALVDEPVLADWSTKTWAGREAKLTVTIADGGERPERLRALADAGETAVLALGGDIGGGWRLANVVLVRSRLVRLAERWSAASDYQLRLYRAAPNEEN